MKPTAKPIKPKHGPIEAILESVQHSPGSPFAVIEQEPGGEKAVLSYNTAYGQRREFTWKPEEGDVAVRFEEESSVLVLDIDTDSSYQIGVVNDFLDGIGNDGNWYLNEGNHHQQVWIFMQTAEGREFTRGVEEHFKERGCDKVEVFPKGSKALRFAPGSRTYKFQSGTKKLVHPNKIGRYVKIPVKTMLSKERGQLHHDRMVKDLMDKGFAKPEAQTQVYNRVYSRLSRVEFWQSYRWRKEEKPPYPEFWKDRAIAQASPHYVVTEIKKTIRTRQEQMKAAIDGTKYDWESKWLHIPRGERHEQQIYFIQWAQSKRWGDEKIVNKWLEIVKNNSDSCTSEKAARKDIVSALKLSNKRIESGIAKCKKVQIPVETLIKNLETLIKKHVATNKHRYKWLKKLTTKGTTNIQTFRNRIEAVIGILELPFNENGTKDIPKTFWLSWSSSFSYLAVKKYLEQIGFLSESSESYRWNGGDFNLKGKGQCKRYKMVALRSEVGSRNAYVSTLSSYFSSIVSRFSPEQKIAVQFPASEGRIEKRGRTIWFLWGHDEPDMTPVELYLGTSSEIRLVA